MRKYLLLLFLVSLVLATSSSYAVELLGNTSFADATGWQGTSWGSPGTFITTGIPSGAPSAHVFTCQDSGTDNGSNNNYRRSCVATDQTLGQTVGGATIYRMSGWFYVPSTEMGGAAVARAYMRVTLSSGTVTVMSPFLQQARDTTGAMVAANVTIPTDTWTYKSVYCTLPDGTISYIAFGVYGFANSTDTVNAYRTPRMYIDDVSLMSDPPPAAPPVGMNNRSICSDVDALVLNRLIKAWGSCADATPSTGKVTAFTISDGYSTPVRVKVAASGYVGTASQVNGQLAVVTGTVKSDADGRYIDLASSSIDKQEPFTITSSAGPNGSISPTPSVIVLKGNNQTFTFTPAPGYTPDQVTIDGGAPVAAGSSYTFTNVQANHTINVTFKLIPLVFTINASAGANGSISPAGAVSVDQGNNQTFTFTGATGYIADQVTIDGGAPVAVGSSYTFTNVQANHTISVSFKADPAYDTDLLFSLRSSALTAGTDGKTGDWPCAYPAGTSLTALSAGTLMNIGGQQWEWNLEGPANCYRFNGPGTNGAWPDAGIPVNGVTIVTAVRPVRATYGNWKSIVDCFYSTLTLGIGNDTGEIMMWRNNVLYWTGVIVPNGQITVLSAVVQPTGEIEIFENGTSVWSTTETSALTALNAASRPEWGNPDFTHYVTVGRNAPDGWTTFNGNIGDTYFYKVALDPTKRAALEAELIAKYPPAANYTITSSAGTGGTIAPVGAITVPQNADQSFVITPDKYFDVTSVLVDSVEAVTGPNAQTYKFANVTGDHSIAASFTEWVATNITGKVALGDGTGVADFTVTATGGREPYTATTGADGTYSIRVKPGVTYTVTAFKRGYTTAPASLSAGPGDLTGKNFTATFVGAQKLIDLKVDPAWTDAQVISSWTNTGTLGGAFISDAGKDTAAAAVAANYGSLGKKAVAFNNSKLLLSRDATTADASLIRTPPSITGNGAYTVLTQICSTAELPYEQYYFAFARDGGFGNCAAFDYGISGAWGAVAHWGWFDMGWNSPEADGGPSINVWHTVAVTFDGATEKVYLDGVMTNSEDKTLDLYTNEPFALGSRFWDPNGWGRDLPFNGALTVLQVWDDALTATQISAAIADAAGNVTISGQVIDGNNNNPVPGAQVVVQVGGVDVPTSAALTGADGRYTAKACLTPGTSFTVHASKLNFNAGDSTPPIAFDGSTTTFTGVDVYVASITTVNISGTVNDFLSGLAVPGLKLIINVPDMPGNYPVTTGTDGSYNVAVAAGFNTYIIGLDPTNSPMPVMLSTLADRTISAPSGLFTDVTGRNLYVTAKEAITGLSGVVQDAATHLPIFNAVVQIGGKTGPAAITGADGRFAFTTPTDGELYADAVGYAGRAVFVQGTGNLDCVIELSTNDEVSTGRSYNGNMEDLAPTFKPTQWEAVPWSSASTSIDWSASPVAQTGSQALFYCYNSTVTADNEYAGIRKIINTVAGYDYNFYFSAKADAEVKRWQPLFEFHNAAGDGVGNYVSNEPDPHHEYSHLPYYDWHTYFNWTDRAANVGAPVRRTPPATTTTAQFIFLYEGDDANNINGNTTRLPIPGKGCYIDDLVLDAVPQDLPYSVVVGTVVP